MTVTTRKAPLQMLMHRHAITSPVIMAIQPFLLICLPADRATHLCLECADDPGTLLFNVGIRQRAIIGLVFQCISQALLPCPDLFSTIDVEQPYATQPATAC